MLRLRVSISVCFIAISSGVLWMGVGCPEAHTIVQPIRIAKANIRRFILTENIQKLCQKTGPYIIRNGL